MSVLGWVGLGLALRGRWSSLLMGWSKLHETERGAAVWRIFWEAGFLPRPPDASFGSLGGMAGDAAVGDSKFTKVL